MLDGKIYVQSLFWASFRTRDSLGMQRTFRLIAREHFPANPGLASEIRDALTATRSQVVSILDAAGAEHSAGTDAVLQGRVESLTITSPVDYFVFDTVSTEGQ